MTVVLALAAIHNLAWGAWVVLDPMALFRSSGIEQPYPQMWQYVGILVGVYGIGYAIAARDPLRHWPIVLVGLLGKLLGPAGFLLAVSQKQLPASWAWTLFANDLVWWVPFGLILVAARHAQRTRRHDSRPKTSTPVEMVLRMARSQRGESLFTLSRRRPRLVVCLRHLGCTFCRETLAEVSGQRETLEQLGVGIVLVHPARDDERAEKLFASYGLADVPRIADPARVLYRTLGLSRGRPGQVLGPRIWWRAALAATRGHLPGAPGGNTWQMPGVFLVAGGRVTLAFRHRDVAERPDFVALAKSGADGVERAEIAS